jgi:hypothetical protein
LDLSRNNHQHTGFKDQTLVKLVQRCRGLRKTGRDGEGLKRTAILRSSQQHLGNTSESVRTASVQEGLCARLSSRREKIGLVPLSHYLLIC